MNDINFDETILPWYSRTQNLLDLIVRNTFQNNNIDLTREQWLLLHCLKSNEGVRQNELADLTFRDKTSLTRLIVTMERKNYIKRITDKRDRRVKRVFIDDEGANVYKQTIPMLQTLAEKIQDGLGSKDIRNLRRISENVNVNIQNQFGIGV